MKINAAKGVLLLLFSMFIFVKFKSRPYPSAAPRLIREINALLVLLITLLKEAFFIWAIYIIMGFKLEQ